MSLWREQGTGLRDLADQSTRLTIRGVNRGQAQYIRATYLHRRRYVRLGTWLSAPRPHLHDKCLISGVIRT
jgi:hypothetical protein